MLAQKKGREGSNRCEDKREPFNWIKYIQFRERNHSSNASGGGVPIHHARALIVLALRTRIFAHAVAGCILETIRPTGYGRVRCCRGKLLDDLPLLFSLEQPLHCYTFILKIRSALPAAIFVLSMGDNGAVSIKLTAGAVGWYG